MARAALRWKVKELAAKAGVSAPTIIRFENERAMPVPSTLKVLRLAFEEAGVTFIEDGMKLRRRKDEQGTH